MKLHLSSSDGNNLITGYDSGWVEINKQRFTNNLILLPDQIIENWDAKNIDSIKSEHIAQIATYKPEVVLLGTGINHRFVHPRLSSALTEIGISVECMSTGAACRTYNILMVEGRKVAAALLL